MKVILIRQPYASLICWGIKTIENRTWDTSYRGRLLIHASGKPLIWPEFSSLPHNFAKEYKKYYGFSKKNIPLHCIKYMEWIDCNAHAELAVLDQSL
jgi:hypothetical protein